jgi:hypothetical protein
MRVLKALVETTRDTIRHPATREPSIINRRNSLAGGELGLVRLLRYQSTLFMNNAFVSTVERNCIISIA